MFTLKINDVSYGVRFQYRGVTLVGRTDALHFVEVDRDTNHDSVRTVCQILKLNDKDRTSKLICEGEATCTLADNFSKSEGRQRSLKKALIKFTSNSGRKIRKAFWVAYFANHKDLRPKRTAKV